MLFDKYRHQSRVILDLFNDYFLAANFRDFQGVFLFDYVIKVSDIIQKTTSLNARKCQTLFYGHAEIWLVRGLCFD